MKTHKIDREDEIDFLILGINSHVRPYKLCWEINKKLKTNFVKTQNHSPQNRGKQSFERYRYKNENTQTLYNILSNRGSFGYLDSNNKSVNYFLVVQEGVYSSKKIIKSLSKIDDVLLVFELNLSKIKSITPFIIND
tara:strand:+ start:310 stop:720 length:411 start_codon:yes stop_codon:yes gene_type:complete